MSRLRDQLDPSYPDRLAYEEGRDLPSNMPMERPQERKCFPEGEDYLAAMFVAIFAIAMLAGVFGV